MDESEVGCQINLATGEHYGECRGSCKMIDEEKLTGQAVMEQGEKALLDMAKIYAAYFKELRSGGFSRIEAFQMVLALQTSHLSGKHSSE